MQIAEPTLNVTEGGGNEEACVLIFRDGKRVQKVWLVGESMGVSIMYSKWNNGRERKSREELVTELGI